MPGGASCCGRSSFTRTIRDGVVVQEPGGGGSASMSRAPVKLSVSSAGRRRKRLSSRGIKALPAPPNVRGSHISVDLSPRKEYGVALSWSTRAPQSDFDRNPGCTRCRLVGQAGGSCENTSASVSVHVACLITYVFCLRGTTARLHLLEYDRLGRHQPPDQFRRAG